MTVQNMGKSLTNISDVLLGSMSGVATHSKMYVEWEEVVYRTSILDPCTLNS